MQTHSTPLPSFPPDLPTPASTRRRAAIQLVGGVRANIAFDHDVWTVDSGAVPTTIAPRRREAPAARSDETKPYPFALVLGLGALGAGALVIVALSTAGATTAAAMAVGLIGIGLGILGGTRLGASGSES